MKIGKIISLVCLVALAQSSSAEYVQGRPVRFQHFVQKFEEVVMVRVSSDASPGVLTISQGNDLKEGTISIDWRQLLERRLRLKNGVKELRYRVLQDRTVRDLELEGKKDKKTIESPLVGETVTGMQDATGSWRLFLDHSSGAEQAVLMDELESYEKRRWFIEDAVNVGDSWDFSPSFIKHIMERELKGAKVEAKMTLKKVKQVNTIPVAVLSFYIRSLGVSLESDASISLNGEVEIDLRNMFDYKIAMAGTMTTASTHKGVTTVVKSPIKYLVTKELK
jgi:hypothetical protein